MTDKTVKRLEMSETMRALRICRADLCNPNCPLYEEEDCEMHLAGNALRVIDYYADFQRPKPVDKFINPIKAEVDFRCPTCVSVLGKRPKYRNLGGLEFEFVFEEDEFCPNCGQALDWHADEEGSGEEW